MAGRDQCAWPSPTSQPPRDMDSPVAWMRPSPRQHPAPRRLCRLHRSISAVRGCTCGPLMRRRFHAEKLRIPVHLWLVRHAGNVAPDHQEHIGSVSFVASFSYVLRRSAYTTQDRQPRSRTLLTSPGPSRADLESVLRNPREATTLRCNLRIALLTYASAQAEPGGPLRARVSLPDGSGNERSR